MKDEAYAVHGFRASAVCAGLKKDGGLDLALIYSDKEAVGAGVFTRNRVKAAPVLVSQEHIQQGLIRAIVANSGNANACTGDKGLMDTRKTAALVAQALGVRPETVVVASTGVIGLPMDMDKVNKAIPQLVEHLSPKGIPEAAKAIMTTDTFPKTSARTGRASGKTYKVVGIAKGAGMIMPDMATMLCFMFTDLEVDRDTLFESLSWAVDRTFNRITVDGDTSTNDMVVIMANGMAGNGPLTPSEKEGFRHVLEEVAGDLARMIVQDGEGATKLVQVCVRGAFDKESALRAARTVANSLLVKTAFYGNDPNWGRIMAALGRSRIDMEERSIDIWIDDVQIVSGGQGRGKDAEERAAKVMEKENYRLTIDLNQGDHEDSVWTCDLSHDYVRINAEYRT